MRQSNFTNNKNQFAHLGALPLPTQNSNIIIIIT